MNRKPMKIKLFIIMAFGLTLINGWGRWNGPVHAETFEVTIANDKTEYEQGEVITITVKNSSKKPVWYLDYPQELRIWAIERFENNKWIDLKLTEKDFFLPVEKDGKQACYVILRERPVGEVAELKPGSEISFRWDQKICRPDNGSKQPDQPLIIEKGLYRLSFNYGLSTKKAIKPEPWERVVDLDEERFIYSDKFTIK